MGKKISLSKARAIRSNDSHQWSAKDMLEDMLERIESGEINPKQIAVHWFEHAEGENGRAMIGRYDYTLSKCTVAEYLMLLEVGKVHMIDALRGCDD